MAGFSSSLYSFFTECSNVALTHALEGRCLRYPILLLLFSMLSVGTRAQSLPPVTADDQMGLQAYQSYHGGDIDSISLSAGTVTLDFPFLSFPQRGKLELSFNLLYNNKPQHVSQFCPAPPAPPTCIWYWDGKILSPGPGNTPEEVGDVFVGWAHAFGLSQKTVTVVTNPGKQSQITQYYYTYYLQFPDGSKHVVGNQGTFSWYNTGTNPANMYEIQGGPFETLDATGLQINGGLGYGYNSTAAVVIGPDGNRYGMWGGTAQDTNGNQITSTLTQVTDTMGRQIALPPTASSAGNTSTSVCPSVGGIVASSAVAWNPPAYGGGTASYTFCYGNITVNPANYSAQSTGPTGAKVLIAIVLPNGQTWQFQYNDPDGTNYQGQPVNFGSLSQITLPTGGTISYTYQYSGPTGTTYPVTCQNGGRWVASRTVNANDGTGAHTWTYGYTYSGGLNTTVTDPLGNDVVHVFGLAAACTMYETQTKYYQGSQTSGTLLKTVNTVYGTASSASRNVCCGALGVGNVTGMINAVPTSITTIWANGQTSKVLKSYDPGFSYLDYTGMSTDTQGNPNVGLYGKEVSETAYDYPSGTSTLQTTNTSYAWQSPNPNYSSYLANNLISLPYSVQVNDSGGTKRAYTYYGYDESSLQSSGISEQKVNGESYPGNQTSVHRWLNGSTTGTTYCSAVTNGYPFTAKAYYDTGEVASVTDPCNYQTNYQYSSTYYGAFVTGVTNALNQSMSYGYDFNTRAVTTITDWNSQITTKNYDMLTRLTSVSYPDGGSVTLCYSDTTSSAGGTCPTSPPFQVTKTQAITSSLNKTTTATFDGLGRLSQTQLNSDPSGVTYTLTTYDALGRKSQVYNPTRCSSITTNCNNETTWGVATTNYDPLGRVASVVEQDGSTVSTNYSAFPCTTVTDEAGNSRQSCVDGLGRRTSVLEDPGSSPHLNYTTNYTYDALGNLTYVNQIGSSGGQPRTRTFLYDSLSELTSAQNPESGTILYAYDADSNVITKTAPLPNQTLSATVTTTNTYDKLNRLIKKGYMDGNNPDPYTPTMQYGYDGVALSGCTTNPQGDTDSYPVGRRTSMCDGSGATSFTHDKMGRVLQARRTIGAVTGKYEIDAYNLDGSPTNVTTIGYGVTYTYSGAARALTATGGTTKFVSSAAYAPPGELAGATLGYVSGGFAGFTVSNAYNDRLQPILLSAAVSGQNPVFSECFDFHLGVAVNTSPCSFSAYSTGDNGNVYQIANNRDSTRTQSFTYDTLNRIASAQSSGTQWGETFTIDSWGNLTNETGIAGKTNHEGLNTSVPLPNNQLSGFGYDAAGNMTSNGTASYVYDAENRLIATAGYSYIYDADGQRVEKCTEGSTPGTCTSGAAGTLYWRGLGSDTLRETDLAGSLQNNYVFFNGQRVARSDSAGAPHYYFSDHLGSHGVVENATGTACEQDIDYYPYGGVENDYCPNVAQNYKFTGKERDSESGLDNFGKRYGASTLGRFMTPDHFSNDTHKSDPQSWNLYTYVRNNPLRFVDPTGEFIRNTRDKKHKLTQRQMAGIAGDLQKKTGLGSVRFDKDGQLTYDKNEVAHGGSAKLRDQMTAAIDDKKNGFELGDYSGSRDFSFMNTDPGTNDNNTGVTTYQVRIDFADFQNASDHSDTQAMAAYSIGLNLSHEINHKVPGGPRGMQTPDEGPGGVIDFVNGIQTELGLPTRDPGSHEALCNNGTCSISFHDQSGGQSLVRWQLEDRR
jgi:RHS repeat-associated protein